MAVVSPYDDADAWDSVKIAVSRSGKSTVYAWDNLPVDFDGDVSNDWDVKKAKGADGAKKTDNGYEASEFSMRWLLWRPEHFQAYEAFVADAKPRPGKEPKPTLVIVHPLLQLYSLTICDLAKIHFLDFKGVDQWEAKIDLIEWFPTPKPTKAAPANSGVITLPETTIVGRRLLSFRRDRPASNGTYAIEPPPLPSQNVRPPE